jgi:hypothetical protein
MATPKSVLVVPEPLIKAVRRKIDDPEAQVRLPLPTAQTLVWCVQCGGERWSAKNRGKLWQTRRFWMLTPSRRPQAEALTALLTISYHPVNVLAFTTEGGLSTVLKAMARHPAHAGVQEAGCAVLRNLAVDGETVRATTSHPKFTRSIWLHAVNFTDDTPREFSMS